MDSRVRASPEQLSTLLEYMETHGDLSRPLAGAQGRIRSDRLWMELVSMLNAVGGGVNKTTDKWKKVWADWKSKTKKKGLAIRRHTGGTGGGPASRQTLSPMEERLLAVMGVLAVEGQASIEELGFSRSQAPAQEVVTIDDMEYLETVDEPSTSQSQTPPFRLLTRAPNSSQGRQPAAPSSAAPPAPPAPSSPPASLPPPASPSPAGPVVPVAPATPRRRRTAALRAPATPPSARLHGRPRSPDTPQSAGSPSRSRLRARRRRQAPTPFDRAATEFVAVESRRLAMEETRTRLQHERDLRALELQHERDLRALEVDHERNEVLRAIVNIAQAWLDYYRSRDNTESLNVE